MRGSLQRWVTVGVTMLLFACAYSSADSDDPRFEQLANRFIESYLKMNPERATELGDHRYDDRLNDYSVAGIEAQRELCHETLTALDRIRRERLGDANRVDYDILHNQLEGTLFRLDVLKEHDWNPLYYNVGGAIYYLVARDFAPLEDRLVNVIARLKMVPQVTALAKANLKNPPKVHIETAMQQNAGTIALVRDELEPFIDQVPKLESDFRAAQKQALGALEYYGSWLERDLLPESDGDFRLGSEKYHRKLGYVLQSDLTPETILKRAEQDLADTQRAMYETALPWYREHIGQDVPADEKTLVRRVLDALAETHPDNDTIVDEARSCLGRCVLFTRGHELVTVPDEPIELIVMPEFQRGVAVAYCDAPGPLEAEGRTFFAISPTPADWPAERVNSFFREYNSYMLQDLTIHEAMPGHYLQLAHANQFKAPTLIRAIFSSGAFVEGWATYAEQLMAENGYGGPEVKLQQLKMRLRMIINAIIDQKIHADGMTEKEALDLMINEGFQEEGEAVGKWRRACLTSTQLSTYYVGNLEINALVAAYKSKYPNDTMRNMHDRLLSFGSPPAKYVGEMLGLGNTP